MRRYSGFTMIELLVALAILGLIISLALPSYRDSIRKTNRSDAHITLSRLATLQERYFFQNNKYTGDFADILSSATSGDPLATDEGHYVVVLTVTGSGTGWNMVATPVGDQTNDAECQSLTLTSLGSKTAVNSNGDPSTACW